MDDYAFKGDLIRAIIDALHRYQKLLSWVDTSLEKSGFLAGDGFSLADIAVIPYVTRLDFARTCRYMGRERSYNRVVQ